EAGAIAAEFAKQNEDKLYPHLAEHKKFKASFLAYRANADAQKATEVFETEVHNGDANPGTVLIAPFTFLLDAVVAKGWATRDEAIRAFNVIHFEASGADKLVYFNLWVWEMILKDEPGMDKMFGPYIVGLPVPLIPPVTEKLRRACRQQLREGKTWAELHERRVTGGGHDPAVRVFEPGHWKAFSKATREAIVGGAIPLYATKDGDRFFVDVEGIAQAMQRDKAEMQQALEHTRRTLTSQFSAELQEVAQQAAAGRQRKPLTDAEYIDKLRRENDRLKGENAGLSANLRTRRTADRVGGRKRRGLRGGDADADMDEGANEGQQAERRNPSGAAASGAPQDRRASSQTGFH
ncbi:MAG: hypothetical protein AB7O67_24025, partial [Vicinamibacterales bacterium]